MEFLLLLVVTLVIAVAVTLLVIFSFKKPIDSIFARIIGEEISVGVASGVNVWKLERFIAPETEGVARPELTAQFWGLEIYRTIIDTLGGLAWALLVFFIATLIAFVIVKRGEKKTG